MHGVRFNCLHCSEELIVMPPEGPGDRVDCPSCSKPCTVPRHSSRHILILGLFVIVAGISILAVRMVRLSRQSLNTTVVYQTRTLDGPLAVPNARENPPVVEADPIPLTSSEPTYTDLYGKTTNVVVALMGKPQGRVSLGINEVWIYEEFELDIFEGMVVSVTRRSGENTQQRGIAH